MQDLMNDMDDLLKKASEAYPLRRGEDRWGEIEAKLRAAGQQP